MLSEIRDQVTAALGYPCPIGLGAIKQATERFPDVLQAEAYLIGRSENVTSTSGYYYDHKGRMVAMGAAAETLKSLERDIQEKDLYIIDLERRMTAVLGATSRPTPHTVMPRRERPLNPPPPPPDRD